MTAIKKLNIGRYGKFENTVFDLAPGLNVVKGDNEAGKTTLQTFTYQMLTGFPTRRVKSEITYFPKDGKPSGAILLVDEDGRECSVERVWRDETVRGASLTDMLHEADSVLLEGVYRIRHRDIQEFGLLDDDAQRDRVFSAGVVGAGTSARSAMKQLEAQALELGGVGKRKGKVKDLVAAITELEARLQDAQAEMEDYPRLDGEVRMLEAQLTGLREEARALRAELGRAELLGNVQPTFNEWLAHLAQLEQQPEARVSQAQATEAVRLQTLEAEISERVGTLSGELSRAEADRDAISLDEALWDNRIGLRALSMELAGFEEKRRQLLTLANELSELDKTLRAHSDALGDIDTQTATNLQVTVQLRSELAEHRQRLESATQELSRAEREAERTSAALANAEHDLNAVPTSPAADCEVPRRALDTVEDLLANWQALDLEAAGLGRPQTKSVKPLLVGVGLSGLGAVAAGLFGQTWLAVFLVVLAVVALTATLVQSRRNARAAARHDEARVAISEQREAIRRDVADACAELEIAWPPAQAELRKARRAVSHAESRASREADAEASRNAAEARVREARRHRDEAKSTMGAAHGERVGAEQHWHSWLQRHELPVTTPTTVERLLDEILRYQDTRTRREPKSALRAQLAAAIIESEMRAQEVLARAAQPITTDVVVGTNLAIAALDGEETARQIHRDASTAASNKASELAQAQANLREVSDKIKELLNGTNVETIERLLERREATEARDGIEAEASRCETSVRGQLGYGPDADSHLEDLKSGDAFHWAELARNAEDRLVDVDDELETAIEHRAAAKLRIVELVRSVEIPSLELELTVMQSQLGDAVREWQTLTLARELIGTALQKYREERQPDVLRDATRYYQQATLGDYDGIQLDDETDEVVVRESATGIYWDVANLSSGTEEPLYLAIRMGLAAEFTRNRGPLPVLMDDVLVNLDPRRRRAMIRAIADFAQEQQVIFFTCHDHVLAEFKELASPNIVLLDEHVTDIEEVA